MSILNIISYIDKSLIKIVPGLQNEYIDPIMIGFTKLGDFGALWIGTVLCLIFVFIEFKKEGIILLSGLIMNLLIGEGILKHIFMRNRPFVDIPEIILKIPAPVTSSFPSGHTSASFCFAFLCYYLFWSKSKIVVYIAWFFAIGISFSRFYLQAHYPSDIISGAILGIISAFLVIVLNEKGYMKKISK